MYLFCCRGQFSHSPGKINQDKITPRRPACVYWALMWVKNTPQKQWVSADFYPDCMWPWLTATAWLHLLRSLCCYISNISECSLYILYLLLEPTCQPQPISLVIHTSDDLPFLCTISKTCCFNKISIFFSFLCSIHIGQIFPQTPFPSTLPNLCSYRGSPGLECLPYSPSCCFTMYLCRLR